MSEKSKSATRQQINGIIDFLEKQLAQQTLEQKKYESYKRFSFSKIAVMAVKDNINNTVKTLDYYKNLKAEYTKKGLI